MSEANIENFKIALAMIVRGADEEAAMLDRCLSNAGTWVDGIFVTITQPNEAVEAVAKKYGANISHFEWCNNFSLARNYNFSQVSREYSYIVWLDADDVPRGFEKLKTTVFEHQYADVFSLDYLYDFDEYRNPIVVHKKTRVIRNDGCVTWAGALHEDFRENRTIIPFFIKNIDILHLTSEDRVKTARERNIVVASEDMEINPNDPRSYWNLGNALMGAGKIDEAINTFDKFLQLSSSDEEKYLVNLRLAQIHFNKRTLFEALDRARYAIGIRPEYPDAYHMVGSIYYELKRFDRARDSYLMGLTMKPPYYSIIVYNPRDYDYNPLMNLAKTYVALSRPDQALTCLKGCLKIYPGNVLLRKMIMSLNGESKKIKRVFEILSKLKKIKDKVKLGIALKKVPTYLRSHPAICHIKNINFIKEYSSGRDLVIYCGFTEERWNPRSVASRGVGGSEEAVIHLSKKLVERGWNVTVYNNCGHQEIKFGRVKYKPFWSWNYRDKQDVVILWRSPIPCDYEINSPKIFVDLHDVVKPGEFNEKRLSKITGIFVKSQFHRSLFSNISDDKFIIIPNGIDSGLFRELESIEKDQYLLINTSSPDRSLGLLVDLWPRIKEAVPEAKMKWAYGWNIFDIAHRDEQHALKWKEEVCNKMEGLKDFENLGRINHDDVAKLYAQANILAYPTDFAEIHCITAVKAQAAGVLPITTDFGALDETVQYGYKIHSDKTLENWCPPYKVDFSLENVEARENWFRAIVETLNTPIDLAGRREMMDWARKTYNWENIADRWHEVLSQ